MLELVSTVEVNSLFVEDLIVFDVVLLGDIEFECFISGLEEINFIDDLAYSKLPLISLVTFGFISPYVALFAELVSKYLLLTEECMVRILFMC